MGTLVSVGTLGNTGNSPTPALLVMPWLFTTVAEVNEGGDKPSSEESLDPVTLRNEASYMHAFVH